MTFISHPNQDEIIKGSGYLFYNPTSIANEAGWGTKLGYTAKENAAYSVFFTVAAITSEDTGIYPIAEIFLGCQVSLYANLTNYNATTCKLLFPALVGGTSNTLVTIPGSLKTGTDNFTTDKILFVPEDTARHPCLYFKNISPHLITQAHVIYSHSRETIFPFGCRAKDFQKGKLSEIVL